MNFIFTGDVLSLVACGEAFNLNIAHPAYKLVVSKLKSATEQEIYKLIKEYSKADVVKANTQGKAELRDNVVYLNGVAVHNSLGKRIIEYAHNGFPIEPSLRFLERVDQNPSLGARTELYDFLEHRNLPLTEDGCFLAYKAVRHDYMDKHTGKISNKPGSIVKMARRDVDDDRRHDCSYGLHVGAIEYVQQFGAGNDRIVIVKVDPKDVVSVPFDYDCTKMRVCQYEVLRDYTGELESPLATADGTLKKSPIEETDWSWMDEDDCDGCDDDCDCDYDDEDDCYNSDEVTSTPSKSSPAKSYLGKRPDGTNYWNKRQGGKFAKR